MKKVDKLYLQAKELEEKSLSKQTDEIDDEDGRWRIKNHITDELKMQVMNDLETGNFD